MFSLRFASEVGEVKTKQTEKLPGLGTGIVKSYRHKHQSKCKHICTRYKLVLNTEK